MSAELKRFNLKWKHVYAREMIGFLRGMPICFDFSESGVGPEEPLQDFLARITEIAEALEKKLTHHVDAHSQTKITALLERIEGLKLTFGEIQSSKMPFSNRGLAHCSTYQS